MNVINKSYYRLITTNRIDPMEYGHGRAQLVDGDIFYSPNSQRTVKRPWEHHGVPYRRSDQHCFTEFYDPLWWQPGCPYLAFVPLEPVYAGVPFSELLDVPPYFPRSRLGFGVDPKYGLGWARLEKLLADAIRMLLSHYAAPQVVWISRTAVGCKGIFRRLEVLRSHFANTRRWFSQWLAAMSYAIAVCKTLENESLDANFPFWFTFLSQQQYSQVFLSALRSSQVDAFSATVERVGVFVQLLHATREQPSVDWFCSYHVPVWYPWGERESRASLTDTSLARFAPSSYILQNATTFITRSPRPLQQAESSQSQPSSLPQGFDCAASTATIASWKDFFERRAARNEQLKLRETPNQRQSRESRENNPPTRRTKVFIWSRIEGGGYCRQSFYQAENGVHLDSYGKNQKRYDSFANEWDCFEEFGEPCSDDVDDGGNSDNEYPPMPPPRSAATIDDALETSSDHYESSSAIVAETFPEPEDRSFSVPAPADNNTFDWEELETAQILYEFLGFVAPLPLPNQPSTLNRKDRSLVTDIVGLTRIDHAFFGSPVANYAATFLNTVKLKQTPPNSTWDIAHGNRLSILSSNMFRRMRLIKRIDEPSSDKGKEKEKDDDDDDDGDGGGGGGNKVDMERWHVFDFKEEATVPWMIAVRNPIDALYICRLDRPGTRPYFDFEVARQLLNRGIQFYTFLRVRPMPRYVGPPIFLQQRLQDYRFSLDDYHAYERDRAALLSNPRVARAALLRGGIVWRLAVATMSFDDVLEGPTTAATVLRQGNILKLDDSVDFCDDGLSQLELDILSGVYRVPDEAGSNYALKSWWPTDKTWQMFSQYTRWTETSNRIFDNRLREIRAGNAQPLTARKWRTNIRGSSGARPIKSFVEGMFKGFIEANANS